MEGQDEGLIGLNVIQQWGPAPYLHGENTEFGLDIPRLIDHCLEVGMLVKKNLKINMGDD